jgi:hypothetical protein
MGHDAANEVGPVLSVIEDLEEEIFTPVGTLEIERVEALMEERL